MNRVLFLSAFFAQIALGWAACIALWTAVFRRYLDGGAS